MTNSNDNTSGDLLDRIEAIIESLARSAQVITNDHEERIQTLGDIVARQEENIIFLAGRPPRPVAG